MRIGNGAAEQFQLDVYGEVVDTVYEAHVLGIEADQMAVSIQEAFLEFLEGNVCARGVDERGVVVQSYGSTELDGAALMIPLVGFLPPLDPRVVAPVDAVARELSVDGFVLRCRDAAAVDGLPPGEARSCCAASGWPTPSVSWAGRPRRRH